MLLIDKLRPPTFDDMELHVSTNRLLANLAKSIDLPHLLFFGPSGAGKKTRVSGLLKGIFGSSVDRLKSETKQIKAPSSSTSITVEITSSLFHIEMSPADLGNKDTLVIQQLIKEAAQTPPPSGGFKVFVIHDADLLSRQAQAALRRTMEKYVSACRIILIAESASKIIPPIKSRCLGIRIPAPTETEITNIIANACKYESIRNINPADIAKAADRNLGKALLLLDAAKITGKISRLPWELYIDQIAKDIQSEQSPKMLLQVRNKFYDLLTSCIPADVIFVRLLKAMNPSKFIDLAAKYQHSAKLGSKHIFHLEAFTASAMSRISSR
jgi:replication factor C subunit 3/5